MRIFGLLLILFCFSCSASENSIREITDKADIQGYELSITTGNGSCILNYNGFSDLNQKVLFLRPPCFFLRRESDKPQYFSYQDVGVDAVLIIVGSPVDENTMKTWNLSNDLDCGEEIRGIFITKNGIKLSKSVVDGGVWCKDKGADEKDFWFFVHEDDLVK